jgi:hypothetical protein
MLDTLGAKILSSKSIAKTATPERALGVQFRLIKWPPAAVMSAPERIKLATMLAGNRMSLSMMAERTGLAVSECAQFCEELRALGLLQVVELANNLAAGDNPGAAGNHPNTSQRLDIVSRIRQRLGLTSIAAR